MSNQPPPPRAGLSLYANLLETDANSDQASISRAPVVSQQAIDARKEQETASTKRPIDAALRFQPHPQIRRPQAKTQKPKAFPKAVAPSTTTVSATPKLHDASNPAPGATPAVTSSSTGTQPQKPTLADWQATQEEDEWVYGTGEKRPRGGRKKKKGGKRGDQIPMETDWNEIYDPSRPTNVDEYLRSDERIREVQEWKALLYKHRRREEPRRRESWSSDEDADSRPSFQNQHPPAGAYNFAPPPMSPPRAAVPDDKTGDDAYMRRLALSQGISTAVPPPPPPPQAASPQPPSSSYIPPPPPEDSSTISRAPVRYTPAEGTQEKPPSNPDAMEEDQEEEDGSAEGDQPRSNRPGQKGFAARLMAKYGWSKGQGLGAESTGIIQPLKVQVEKRKKNEDGKFTEPGGRGKIIGPKTNPSTATVSSSSTSKFGPTSNVIVLRNMLDGMPDLQTEMENGLGQEIGEECGDKYGRVERLYIDVEGRRVYIKFTDGVSALRAVNALDGRVFNGNVIVPQFYDAEKFGDRVYE